MRTFKGGERGRGYNYNLQQQRKAISNVYQSKFTEHLQSNYKEPMKARKSKSKGNSELQRTDYTFKTADFIPNLVGRDY
ncbi:hypothetical protein L218DRAFT_243769 [Marasmius fiardii PR-910]|nr:hypothetical protein L218DRAFT_243769 [Marasmius fiardii PR-910]